MSQKMEKVHNFLDPPSPRMIWIFLYLGKILKLAKNHFETKLFFVQLKYFKCFKLKFHVLREGSKNSKFSQFQIFPKLGTGEKFQIFPKFKKVQIILGEGGSRKLWTFPTVL